MTSLPILLINLDRAAERLARLGARLEAEGLTFERVPAVDARHLSLAELERPVDGVGYWGKMTSGEVACFLSHRKCWQVVVNRGLAHAVVLEDDVVPGVSVGDLLSTDGWIPADADLVKLETDFKSVRLATRVAGRCADRNVMRLHSSHYCAAAYLVTWSAARHLLAATERFRDAVDEMLFAERSSLSRSLTIYQMAPAPFVQEHKHADASSVFDASGFIDGREAKERPRRPVLAGLAADLVQARRDLSHKVRAVAGHRRTVLVDFR